MPKVYNKRDRSIPAGAIYVGRPTKWGNPFRVGEIYNGRKLMQGDAVELHRDWLLNSDRGKELLSQIDELRGKDLICWCAPRVCHADLLLELANEAGGSK